MDTSAQLERIAKSIRGLTVAVWCLVAISLVQIAGWLIPFLAPSIFTRHFSPEVAASAASFESWEDLPFEERAKRASVVLITENKRESGRVRAIVKEILKKQPNTTFYYGVGDEYGPASFSDPKPNTQYGDGALVLLAGSPATNHGSYAIYGGTIPALGEMPLSKAREIVANAK